MPAATSCYCTTRPAPFTSRTPGTLRIRAMSDGATATVGAMKTTPSETTIGKGRPSAEITAAPTRAPITSSLRAV